MSVFTTPVFLLRGVDHSKVLEKLESGFFNDISISDIKGSTVTEKQTSNPNQVYFKDKNGNLIILVYSNVNQKCCDWCRRNITSDMEPVGIPVKVTYKQSSRTYDTDGCFCTFQCAYAQLKQHNKLTSTKRDSLYESSSVLLHNLFHQFYPNKELVAANDWRLLDSNGGCLTPEEFFDESFVYKRNSNTIIREIKVEYLKTKG